MGDNNLPTAADYAWDSANRALCDLKSLQTELKSLRDELEVLKQEVRDLTLYVEIQRLTK